MYGISRKLGIPFIKLTAVNNKLNPNLIRPGDPIIIPFDSMQSVAYNREPQRIIKKNNIPKSKQIKSKKPTYNTRYYIVKKGDTLWNIARRFNTSVDELKNKNKLYSANALLPGKRLIITD